MTTDDVKNAVKKHRRSAGYGGLVGVLVVLALCGWAVLEYALTPGKPNIGNASASEIVSFVADPRGLPKLSQFEQEEFLRKWKLLVMSDGDKKRELSECFDHIESKERKSFTEAVFRHMKRTFMDDAERYIQLRGTDEAFAFLRAKQDQYRDDGLFIKEVAAAFERDFDTRPEKLQEWLLRNTTAEERTLGEPFIEALKRIRIRLRKERRAEAPVDRQAADSRS